MAAIHVIAGMIPVHLLALESRGSRAGKNKPGKELNDIAE